MAVARADFRKPAVVNRNRADQQPVSGPSATQVLAEDVHKAFAKSLQVIATDLVQLEAREVALKPGRLQELGRSQDRGADGEAACAWGIHGIRYIPTCRDAKFEQVRSSATCTWWWHLPLHRLLSKVELWGFLMIVGSQQLTALGTC